MTTYSAHLHINLDAPIYQLQQSLRRVLSLTAHALHCNEQSAPQTFTLPAATFHLGLGDPVNWSPAQARAETAHWLLACGLRDAVESLNLFLDEVNKALSGWQIAIRSAAGNPITIGELRVATEDQPNRFHKLGMPDKLRHFSSAYDFETDAVLRSHVLSINAARRCMVHRFGMVGPPDSASGSGLRVTWERIAISVTGTAGERIVIPPADVEGGEVVRPVAQQQAREFPLATRVSFSQQEFAELLYCLFAFGVSTLNLLKQYAAAHGLTIQELPAGHPHPKAAASSGSVTPGEPLP